MRSRLDIQLMRLNEEMIDMGAVIEQAIDTCIHAMDMRDKNLAKRVMGDDRDIDQKERDIENLCLRLLLQQQPVAGDLRFISAALKIVTDMERIGDYAVDISEIVISAVPTGGVQGDAEIRLMAKKARTMVGKALDAFVKRDCKMAQLVIDSDDEVDELFLEIRRKLIEAVSGDQKAAEYALDLMMVDKYLERIGDHAVNIARWVNFVSSGSLEDSRHDLLC